MYICIYIKISYLPSTDLAEMNRVTKSAISNLQSNHLYHQRAALFHSTPVLESKRRSHWKSSKKHRKQRGKGEVLRNLNAYADYILQGWKDRFKEDDDPSSMRGPSWFTKQYGRGSRREWPQWPGNQGRWHSDRRAFEFCEDDDDDDVDTIFRSSFEGNRFFYFSFINEESPRWRTSFGHSKNHGKSWNFRYRDEDDYYDSSSESEMPESSDSDMAADRLALGLRAYGPITLEDVKTAYRACALKWHPDRHQGSYKAIAEEKFKLCSSAYQSLCDKMAMN